MPAIRNRRAQLDARAFECLADGAGFEPEQPTNLSKRVTFAVEGGRLTEQLPVLSSSVAEHQRPCCATLILSMVATLCVPTESSCLVRQREDDVKPSPACDGRQRSRWCGEEHRLHQFRVTRTPDMSSVPGR